MAVSAVNRVFITEDHIAESKVDPEGSNQSSAEGAWLAGGKLPAATQGKKHHEV